MRALITCGAGLVLLVGAVGCGGGDDRDRAGGTPSPTAEQDGAAPVADALPPVAPLGVPPVTVLGADGAVDLQPWTACWVSGCADGAPPEELVDLGDPEELVVTFPAAGWSFEAVLVPADDPCGPRHRAPVERVGDREHVVRPAGPAAAYDVEVFGRGPEGDVVVTARWTTPVAGPLTPPTASLALLADHDGAVDSYGVELVLDELAATPEEATGAITVTSAEGRSTTIDVAPVDAECGEEGQLLLVAPVELGQEAAALGSPPFTYDVDLVLDGRDHAATATWPADVLEDAAPAVGLSFVPALPGAPAS